MLSCRCPSPARATTAACAGSASSIPARSTRKARRCAPPNCAILRVWVSAGFRRSARSSSVTPSRSTPSRATVWNASSSRWVPVSDAPAAQRFATHYLSRRIKLKTVSATMSKYLAALALGWCSVATVQAQTEAPMGGSRIAWLSPERIYNESKLAKLAGDKLAEEFKGREKAVQEMAGRLKAASEKLDKELPALGEAERARRQHEYLELDKEFQRRQREFHEDLNQRTNEERAAISEKATRVIKQLAQTEGFDIVLQDAVWASPRIDITDKVLAALDKDK